MIDRSIVKRLHLNEYMGSLKNFFGRYAFTGSNEYFLAPEYGACLFSNDLTHVVGGLFTDTMYLIDIENLGVIVVK